MTGLSLGLALKDYGALSLSGLFQPKYAINYLNSGGKFKYSVSPIDNTVKITNYGTLADATCYAGNPYQVVNAGDITVGEEGEYVTVYTTASGWSFNNTAPYALPAGVYSYISKLSTPLTTADQAILETDMFALDKLKRGDTDTGLSISASAIDEIYIPNTISGATLKGYDIANDIAISNYSVNNYLNNDFNTKGHQLTAYTLDASGRVTGFDDTKLSFHTINYITAPYGTQKKVKVTATLTPNTDVGSIIKSSNQLSLDTQGLSLGVSSSLIAFVSLSSDITVGSLLDGTIHDFKVERYNDDIYSIGVPGTLGFGVASVRDEDLPVGWTRPDGHFEIGNENYGRVIHPDGAEFVWIPKHYYRYSRDNKPMISPVSLDGYVLDRTFINGGVELNGVFTFAFGGSNNGGKLSSQKNAAPVSTSTANNPIGNLNTSPANNYGGIYKAAKSCDSAAYTVPMWHRKMLARLAVAHGKASTSTAICAFTDVAPYQPKGNNNNALADHADTSVTFTSAGNATYPNCALTGSGVPFAKTTHNGQECGIADLNGNMWEAVSGLTYMARTGATGTSGTNAVTLAAHGYTVGQKIAFGGTPYSGTTYNTAVHEVATIVDADNFTLVSVLERDILATDGIYTGKTFYMLKESVDIRTLADDSTTPGTGAFDISLYDQIDLSDLFTGNGVWRKLGNGVEQVFEFSTDRNSDGYKRASLGLPRLAGQSLPGTTEYGNDGIYTYFRHELVPIAGGSWSFSSNAGVGAAYFSYSRTSSLNGVGVRASYIKIKEQT